MRSIKSRIHAAFAETNAEAADMFEGEPGNLPRAGSWRDSRGANQHSGHLRPRPCRPGRNRTHPHQGDGYLQFGLCRPEPVAGRTQRRAGVGWVSIFPPARSARDPRVAGTHHSIAYLCLGHVSHFYENRNSEAVGWRPRLPLEDLVFSNNGNSARGGSTPLVALREAQALAIKIAASTLALLASMRSTATKTR